MGAGRQKRPRRQCDIISGWPSQGQGRRVEKAPAKTRRPALHRPLRAFRTAPSSRMTSDAPPSFEAALAELEALVATMESGQLPLKESLAAFERGAKLLAYCQDALKDAQQQV